MRNIDLVFALIRTDANLMAQIGRFRTHWLPATGAMLFVLAVIFSHVYGPSQLSLAETSWENSLHAPGFAVIASLIFAFVPKRFSGASRYLVAGTAAMMIGVLSEAAQIPGPRDADLMDLIADAIGIFGALGVLALFDASICARLAPLKRWVLSVSSLLALFVTVSPTLWYSYALVAQYRALPSLHSFEHSWERVNFTRSGRRIVERIKTPKNWPNRGKWIAQVEEGRRRGTLLHLYPYPDWRDYTNVSFLAASTTEASHEVKVSIRDMLPDKRNRDNQYELYISVGPQPRRYYMRINEIRDASANRKLDIAHIDSIILSVSRPGSNVELLVDDFRLEP